MGESLSQLHGKMATTSQVHIMCKKAWLSISKEEDRIHWYCMPNDRPLIYGKEHISFTLNRQVTFKSDWWAPILAKTLICDLIIEYEMTKRIFQTKVLGQTRTSWAIDAFQLTVTTSNYLQGRHSQYMSWIYHLGSLMLIVLLCAQ